MARQIISINELIQGAQPTDPRRTAYRKINENFAELYLGVPNSVVLGSDVVNNNAVANTIADVTGLSFPVVAGSLYEFEFNILYAAALTTTGSRWAINGPAFTVLNYRSEYTLTASSSTRNAMLSAYDQPAGANASSGSTTSNWAVINGIIVPSANGNVIARFASEILSSAITAKAGSFVRYVKVT